MEPGTGFQSWVSDGLDYDERAESLPGTMKYNEIHQQNKFGLLFPSIPVGS